jgi:hypothetical protein
MNRELHIGNRLLEVTHHNFPRLVLQTIDNTSTQAPADASARDQLPAAS